MYSDDDTSKAATAGRLRQLLIERRVPPEALDDFRFYVDMAYREGFRSPGAVSDYLHGVVPLDLPAAVKFARAIGCNIDSISSEFRSEIDEIAQQSYEVVTQSELAEVRGQRLKELASVIPGWFGHRHEAVKQKVVNSVRDTYASIEPPVEHEGVRDGLEFFGILKWHGSDHVGYQSGMDALDAEIRREIKAMDADDQIALLLPLCGGGSDIEELVAEQCVEEWPGILLKHFSDRWEERLRDGVLECVEARDPHDLPQMADSES